MRPSLPALIVGTLAACLFPLLAWSVARHAPPGQVFVGDLTVHEDISKYLGYAQQVSEGRLLFRNKLNPSAHSPQLLNLEWALAGALSWALGNRPLLAFRLIGALATLLLAGLAEAWLLDCGLARSRRIWALALFFVGGGLGGVALLSGRSAALRPYDLLAAFYPFLMVIVNPHFVVGIVLVLASLRELARDRVWRGVALCTVIALVRPYDCVLVPFVDLAVVMSSLPPRQWVRRLAPWLCIIPVVAYDAWLFVFSGVYADFSYGAATSTPHYRPSVEEMAWALGPAAVLALTAFVRPAPVGARARKYLAYWAVTAGTIVAVHPVSFALQSGVGIGAPLLILSAVGLSALGRGALELATVLLSGSLLVFCRVFWLGAPSLYVADTVWQLATVELPRECRAGQLLLAEEEIGMLAESHGSCTLYLPYSLVPGYQEKRRELAGFYGSWPAERRAELLEEACVDHVVLPGRGEEVSAEWLGEGAPFRRTRVVTGSGPALQVASRIRPCQP